MQPTSSSIRQMLSEGHPEKQPPESLRVAPFYMPLSPADSDDEWDNLPVLMNPPGEPRE